MAGIPGPRETDAEDVALKLEVAQTQWTRGDHAEALKWLRKAADAAFDADDDKRGIELSKLAAELTAQDKTAPKPKLPPPRDPIAPARAAPVRPSAPPAPPVRPSAPAPQSEPTTQPHPGSRASEPSRRGGDAKLSATGARRAAAARAAEARATQSARRGRSSRKSSPNLEEEATREYIVADVVKTSATDPARTSSDAREEWPTESVGNNVEEPVVPPEHTESRPISARSRTADDAEPTQVGQTVIAATAIPFTQALRVAVGRAADGRVVLRLLDAQGLREGERDALLVALTNESITTLFTGG